jgi:hypothetical protein
MLLKTEISTSQGIAKALKGPGLSCGEKIDTAVTAWEMSSIYFPHKDEFLLDWLSSMLVKPPTKKYAFYTLYDNTLMHRKTDDIFVLGKRKIPNWTKDIGSF